MDMVVDAHRQPYDVTKYARALATGKVPDPIFCGGKDRQDRLCRSSAAPCAFGPNHKVKPYFRATHVPGCDEGKTLVVTEIPGDRGRPVPVQLGPRAYYLKPAGAGPEPDRAAVMRRPDDQVPGDTTMRRVRVGTDATAPVTRPRPRGLKRILHDLYHDTYDPDSPFEVPRYLSKEFPSAPFSTFFVRVSTTSADHTKLYRGWWGRVTQAWVGQVKRDRPRDEPPTWLALDETRPPVRVCVPAGLARSWGLWDRGTVGRIAAAPEVYVLALGQYRIPSGGSPYISLPWQDPASFFYVDVDRELTS